MFFASSRQAAALSLHRGIQQDATAPDPSLQQTPYSIINHTKTSYNTTQASSINSILNMTSYLSGNNAGRNNQGSSNKETRVQISLYASKLKNVAGLGKGVSDPYAVVTLLAGGPQDKPNVLGKTEV